MPQALDHQAAAVVQRLAHPQGHVDAFVEQVHGAVAHQHVDTHLGVTLQKGRQRVPQHRLRQRHRAAQSHQPARRHLQRGHGVLCGTGGVAHGGAVAEEGLTHVGNGNAAGGALQQTGAQLGFQLGDAARQARLGDTQAAPGSGETTLLHHLGEIQHVVQILHSRLIVLNLEQSKPFKATSQSMHPPAKSLIRHTPWPTLIESRPPCNSCTSTPASWAPTPCPAN